MHYERRKKKQEMKRTVEENHIAEKIKTKQREREIKVEYEKRFGFGQPSVVQL